MRSLTPPFLLSYLSLLSSCPSLPLSSPPLVSLLLFSFPPFPSFPFSLSLPLHPLPPLSSCSGLQHRFGRSRVGNARPVRRHGPSATRRVLDPVPVPKPVSQRTTRGRACGASGGASHLPAAGPRNGVAACRAPDRGRRGPLRSHRRVARRRIPANARHCGPRACPRTPRLRSARARHASAVGGSPHRDRNRDRDRIGESRKRGPNRWHWARRTGECG